MTPEEIAVLEQDWIGRVQVTGRDTYLDWQPAPVEVFSSLLAACLPHMPAGNRSFIDAGCGIGTKALLAQAAGLDAYGLDRVPEYVAEAIRVGVAAWEGYAEDYDAYGRYGCVYVNHPLACGPGCGDEAALEHAIHVQMAPGSVLMAVNYDLAPGCAAHPPSRPCGESCPRETAGWAEVARAGPWHAAWVKP